MGRCCERCGRAASNLRTLCQVVSGLAISSCLDANGARQPGRVAPDADIRRERAERTHGRAERAILAATEQLLVQRPLNELSVADIIDAAAISRTSFYVYFASKTSVIAECLRQVMAEVMVAVDPGHLSADRSGTGHRLP